MSVAFIPAWRRSSVYSTNICRETVRAGPRAYTEAAVPNRSRHDVVGRLWSSDNHTNIWRACLGATGPEGEGLAFRRALRLSGRRGKAFGMEMPALGSAGWVGVNQAEKGEKLCGGGGCCAGSWRGRFALFRD